MVTPYGTVNDQSGQAKRAKLYTWNADGAVLSIEQLNGSQAVSTDSFTYDSQLNLTEETKTDADSNLLAQSDCTYDSNGNMLTKAVTRSTSPSVVDTTSYTYDTNNDLTSETLPNMDGNGPSISYQYDAYGNMTAKKQQLNTGGDSLSQYTYDSHGRLTEQQDLSPALLVAGL